MPFTLAHPAVVLCLPEKPFLHRGALVLGAMSPDFIYFLQGRAANGFGHTLLGALCLNLPLGLIFSLETLLLFYFLLACLVFFFS